jgi:hypothetical protein
VNRQQLEQAILAAVGKMPHYIVFNEARFIAMANDPRPALGQLVDLIADECERAIAQDAAQPTLPEFLGLCREEVAAWPEHRKANYLNAYPAEQEAQDA